MRATTALRSRLRTLVRRPTLTLVIVATLAVGIGANTAIFSLVYGVLLQPLPYPEADRLITLWEDHSRRGGPPDEWTGRSTFMDWRSDSRVFEEVAAYTGWGPNLTGDGDPERLSGLTVSPGWFKVLGVEPNRGRAFEDEEGSREAPPQVILSHGLWQRRFGGEEDLVGRTIRLDDEAVTVAGILPASFEPLFGDTEVWRPLTLDRSREDRGNYFLRVVARLRDGVDAESVQRDMDRVAALVAERSPAHYGDVAVKVIPLHERLVGPARPAILALGGAVGLLLLVAWTNVANLLLVDAVGRWQELSVRASLGAGRLRLGGLLILDGLSLAAIGGAAGLACGAVAIRGLVALAPQGTPRIDAVGLHGPVVVFALVLTLMTGIAAGLLPALQAARIQPASALRPGTRVEGRGQGRLRAGLVIAQTAVALCLLAGAGLLVRSFWGLLQVDLGFKSEGVVTTSISLPRARYGEAAERVAFYDRLTAALATRPEIERAAATSILPLSRFGSDVTYYVEGAAPAPEGERPSAWFRMVTPDFLDTAGIGVLRGAMFDRGAHLEAPKVVAVSERFAKRWFGEGEAVGRRMKFGGHDEEGEWMTIVAVIRDVRDRSAMQPHRDNIYLPHAQWGRATMSIMVRARDGLDAAALMPALREEVRRLDPRLPVAEAVALSDIVADTLWLPRFGSQVVSSFALAALILAALGLYGVLARSVQARLREMGIRQALGADRSRVLRLVLGHGLRLAAVGVGVGAVLTWSFSHLLGSVLHDIEARDPTVFAAASGVLLLTALLASWLPAARAARTDPATCLREE